MKCEREQQIIEATRNGLWTSALRTHLQGCALCSQTERIAASVQEDAAEAERGLDLPPASVVWRRAQAKRRADALQRVTRRPFLLVGTLGAIYSVVLLLWGLSQLPQSVYRLLAASPEITGNLALAGIALSATLAVAGSCVLVLEAKR